jgi:hypothetical protein
MKWVVNIVFTIALSCSAVAQADFKITTISPLVIYPTGKDDHAGKLCRITLIGEKLQGITKDNLTVFLNETKVEGLKWEKPSLKPEAHRVYGWIESNARQVDLWLPWSSMSWVWPDYHGRVQIRLGLNNEISEPVEIVVAGVDSRWWPVVFAAITSLLILLLPVGLMRLCRTCYTINDRKFGVLAVLFLDKETDTYSLSKFQFYAWTAAAVFGYFVLTLAQSLVQAKFDFADIPKGLPGIIFISAATTVVAQGITSTRGSKGAGRIYPCCSDFVSTGGLIVAERFQFFVWTVVGVFTFLFLVIFSDPANLNDLPTIPDGFLQLMGISSAGYLGGKLARKPGPIIDEITARVSSLVLTIRGRKLSDRASLKIDNQSISGDQLVVKGSDPDGDSQPPELYHTLTVTIAAPQNMWKRGKHYVTFINPDGQEAQWFYSLPVELAVDEVNARMNGESLSLEIKGSQLSKNATFTINQLEVKKSDHGLTVTEVGEPCDPPQPAEFYSGLKLNISKPLAEWKQSETLQIITITNPDGKSAVANLAWPSQVISEAAANAALLAMLAAAQAGLKKTPPKPLG